MTVYGDNGQVVNVHSGPLRLSEGNLCIAHNLLVAVLLVKEQAETSQWNHQLLFMCN